MKKILLPCILLVASCTSYKNYYKLDEDYLSRRQIETARFETQDEMALLSASVNLLQDMGYTLGETEPELGLVTAYKDKVISRPGVKAFIIFVTTLGGMLTPVGVSPFYLTERRIFITLATTKSPDGKGTNVRADFTQTIMTNKEYSRQQKIKDPEIYKIFFDRLGQTVSLPALPIQE